MRCPQCKTENRDDRATCYHCGQDLRPLARVLNRARNHYNSALEHAERDRLEDAKRELQNALDLDSSFVSAWLVLGTVNARMEHFEEARAAWEKALSLDHRFEKAHEYLMRAERIEPILPALNNLKLLAGGLFAALLVVLVLGGGAIWYLARPDRAMERVELALQYQAAGEWGEAIRQLEWAQEAALAPETSREIAAALHDQLSERLRESVQDVRALAAAGDLAAAVQGLNRIQGWHPSGPIREEVEEIEEEVGQRVLERAESAVRMFRQGEIEPAALNQNFQTWLGWLEGDPRHDEVAELYAQVSEEGEERLLAEIRSEVLGIENLGETVRRLNDYATRYPELRPQIQELRQAQIEAAADRLLIRLDAALDQGNPAAARERLVELRALYETFGMEPPAEQIARAEEMLRGQANVQTLDRIEAAFRAGNHVEVIELATQLNQQDWSEERWERIETLLQESRRRLADQLWAWTQDLDPYFEDLLITRDQALRLIQYHDLMIEYAPEAERAFRAAVTLYRTATAYLRLGEVQQAAETIERLRREYPNASVLGWPPFQRFEARLQAELAQAQPAPEAATLITEDTATTAAE